MKVKLFLKKLFLLLLFGLIFFAVGSVIAILIANKFNYKLQDTMFYEGLILFVIGLLMSLSGNPSGISINGIGQSNENGVSYINLETTRVEREMNPYYKNYFRNNMVKFAFSNLTFIIGGIFIIAFSIIFL